jgi:uncharacterized membrane protein YsdA (DUF1294 family)
MISEYQPHLLLLYLLVNGVVFCVYGWDKRAARLRKRRIREKTLLLIAFAGGGAGAFAAQRLLRHKTRKPPFRFVLPLLFVQQAILVIALLASPDIATLRHNLYSV